MKVKIVDPDLEKKLVLNIDERFLVAGCEHWEPNLDADDPAARGHHPRLGNYQGSPTFQERSSSKNHFLCLK